MHNVLCMYELLVLSTSSAIIQAGREKNMTVVFTKCDLWPEGDSLHKWVDHNQRKRASSEDDTVVQRYRYMIIIEGEGTRERRRL